MNKQELSPAARMIRMFTEQRGEYIAFLIQAMKGGSADYQTIARSGLISLGCLRGERACKGKAFRSPQEFFDATASPAVREAFEMNPVYDGDILYLHCGRCPLLDAWRKLPLSAEECRELCEIVMSGDMQQYASTKGITCEWKTSLAHGDKECLFVFRASEEEDPLIRADRRCTPTDHPADSKKQEAEKDMR